MWWRTKKEVVQSPMRERKSTEKKKRKISSLQNGGTIGKRKFSPAKVEQSEKKLKTEKTPHSTPYSTPKHTPTKTNQTPQTTSIQQEPPLKLLDTSQEKSPIKENDLEEDFMDLKNVDDLLDQFYKTGGDDVITRTATTPDIKQEVTPTEKFEQKTPVVEEKKEDDKITSPDNVQQVTEKHDEKLASEQLLDTLTSMTEKTEETVEQTPNGLKDILRPSFPYFHTELYSTNCFSNQYSSALMKAYTPNNIIVNVSRNTSLRAYLERLREAIYQQNYPGLRKRRRSRKKDDDVSSSEKSLADDSDLNSWRSVLNLQN
jgi:hypothetical protein